MPSANADLPMLGRPATTTRLPGWRPEVIWSMSRKPVGVPVISPPDSYIFVICSKLSRTSDLDVLEAAADAVLGEVEDHLLGAVDELGRLAGAVPAEPLDLLADDREPAQRRHLADDPRVVAGVRGRRDERRDLVDALLAADLLELAVLVELVGDRDRVDRLAVLVELERGAVDLGVRLAVEVARVDDRRSTASIAVAESIIAPRTYSSASRFWGGAEGAAERRAGRRAWDVAIRG